MEAKFIIKVIKRQRYFYDVDANIKNEEILLMKVYINVVNRNNGWFGMFGFSLSNNAEVDNTAR